MQNVSINGCDEQSLYTVINEKLPATYKAAMLLFPSDIDGIACSEGSACSIGSNQRSHVSRALHVKQDTPSVRFSFSRYTTKDEIDFTMDQLVNHFQKEQVVRSV